MLDDVIGDGLHFRCIPGCARCCRGTGYVFVSEEEGESIANFLKISFENFKKQYTTFKDTQKRILKDKKDKEECIFLNDDYTCAIYKVRPNQCKTYPFWASILKDRESLNYEKLRCPGLGSGKFYSKNEILKILNK